MENYESYKGCDFKGARIYVRVEGNENVKNFSIAYPLRFDQKLMKIGIIGVGGKDLIFPRDTGLFGFMKEEGLSFSFLVSSNEYPLRIVNRFISQTAYSSSLVLAFFVKNKIFVKEYSYGSLLVNHFPDISYKIDGEFVIV